MTSKADAIEIGQEVLADRMLHRIAKEYRHEGPREQLQRFIKSYMGMS